MVREGTVSCRNGEVVKIQVDTVCIHVRALKPKITNS